MWKAFDFNRGLENKESKKTTIHWGYLILLALLPGIASLFFNGRHNKVYGIEINIPEPSKVKEESKKEHRHDTIATLQALQKTLKHFFTSYRDRKTQVAVGFIGAPDEEAKGYREKMLNLIKMKGYTRVDEACNYNTQADDTYKHPYMDQEDGIVIIHIPCP